MNASDEKPRKGETGYLAVAIGILIVILFIGFGWYFSGQPGPATQSAAPEQAAGGDNNAASGQQADKGGNPAATMQGNGAQRDGAQAPARQEKPAESSESADAAETAGVVPTFDTIRIEPDGDTVVAGLAAPGADVTLFADSEEVASAVADAAGNWAMILDKPLPSGPSDLWVTSEKGGAAVRSKQQLAVVVDPEGKKTPLVVVQDDTGSRVMQEPAEVAAADRPAGGTEANGGKTGGAMASASGGGKMAADTRMAEKPSTTDAGQMASRPAAKDERMAAASPSEGRPATASPDTTSGGQGGQQMAAASPSGGTTAGEKSAQGAQDKPAQGKPAASAAPVRIEAADYDNDGNLYVSGKAAPGATVRLYYDNDLLGDTKAGGAGRWSLSAKRPLDGGVHTLRGDQVAPGSGDVIARAEVSLIAQIPEEAERQVADAGAGGKQMAGAPPQMAARPDAPRDKSAAPASASSTGASGNADTGTRVAAKEEPAMQDKAAAPRPRSLTVKRGDNLWRIARGFYGRGIRYTTIYEANKDQIRDPDLIYPDQVFLIPRRVEGEAAN